MLLGGILLVVQGKNQQEYPRGRPGNFTTRTGRVGLLVLAQSSNGSSGSFAATKLPALVKPGMGVGVELHRGGSLEHRGRFCILLFLLPACLPQPSPGSPQGGCNAARQKPKLKIPLCPQPCSLPVPWTCRLVPVPLKRALVALTRCLRFCLGF